MLAKDLQPGLRGAKPEQEMPPLDVQIGDSRTKQHVQSVFGSPTGWRHQSGRLWQTPHHRIPHLLIPHSSHPPSVILSVSKDLSSRVAGDATPLRTGELHVHTYPTQHNHRLNHTPKYPSAI